MVFSRDSDLTSYMPLRRPFATWQTLADLMSWCAQQSPRVQVGEIVTQDEYTHDVVLGFGSVFLSFDTT